MVLWASLGTKRVDVGKQLKQTVFLHFTDMKISDLREDELPTMASFGLIKVANDHRKGAQQLCGGGGWRPASSLQSTTTPLTSIAALAPTSSPHNCTSCYYLHVAD